MKFLVIVKYGSRLDYAINRFIGDYCSIFEDIIVIDTSDTNKSQSINNSFEFSGYEYGFKIAQSKLVDGCLAKIIFLNDTAFSSHSSLLLTKLLFVMNSYDGIHEKSIVGIVNKIDSDPSQFLHSYGYCSSWIFMLVGTHLNDRALFFAIPTSDFFDNILPKLPVEYIKSIDRWLKPKSLLKGWYKANPWIELGLDEYFRKQYTIYNEHTLLQRFSKAGFIVVDLVSHLNLSDYAQIYILTIFDRISNNGKKLIYRLRTWLKLKIKH